AYPASDQEPPCATGCSRAQGPSGASPARSSAHRTPGATDNTSPRSRRSDGLRPPCSGLVRPEHRSAATWRRSLQACIASLPLQSSLMSKTYLKSDHFSGGGSTSERLALVTANARSLPALTYSMDAGTVPNITCTRPPSRSVSAGASPRYGTWTMLTRAIILNSSPDRWPAVPLPPEPMLTLLGFFSA